VVNTVPFAPGLVGVKISATASSSATKLNPATGTASGCPQLRIYNAGSVIVYVECGDSSVVAVKDTSLAIPPGAQVTITCNRRQYLGVITDSSTASVYVTPGYGGV